MVSGLRREWTGAVEVDVRVGDTVVPALAYPQLTGRPEPGDQVLLNATALELGLGTGGYALVIAIPGRLPPDPPGPGHLVKARYTPLQATVLSADEQGSPYHELLCDADDLAGMPVVIADLHSALPAVLAAFYSQWAASAGGRGPAGAAGSSSAVNPGGTAGNPGGTAGSPAPRPRAAYVMLDGGALPAWFSRTAAALREAGWLAGVVTVGQAFGGDLEAVTLHSGLLVAREVLGAAALTASPEATPENPHRVPVPRFPGPCETTATAAVLGGRPVASLRVSEADPRERHRGISHHSLTAYGRVALARADVVVPELPGEFGARLLTEAAPLAARHSLVRVSVDGLTEVLRACPVPLSTMGRGLDEDPSYFLAAAAAGRHAAALTGSS